jgi:hypothetical protein
MIKQRLKPREERVETRVEPIVSEEIWDQCNAILNERQKKEKSQQKDINCLS